MQFSVQFQPVLNFSVQIVELILDDCKSDGKIEGISEDFSSLKTLSVSNAGLCKLDGFPKLIKLQKV